jgi:hypothetical protein
LEENHGHPEILCVFDLDHGGLAWNAGKGSIDKFLTFALFPGIKLVTVASHYWATNGIREYAEPLYGEENSLARANEETIGQTRLGLSEWVELECR